MTKDELRAQIVKLEATVETLRAKAAAARKDARTAAARIAELEGQVAAKPQPAAQAASIKPVKPASTRAARRGGRPTPKAQAPAEAAEQTVVADGSEAATGQNSV